MQYGDFAQVYDRLMSDVDYDCWAQYIDRIIKENRGGLRIAECACGTGALTIRLKKIGYDITGFDISQEMLDIAAGNARAAAANIRFVCMDMKKLALHRPHDVIIAACDGVNYLLSTSELHEFFTHANMGLKPGGLLLFDISSEYKLSHVLGLNTFAEDTDDCAYIWQNNYDPVARLIEMRLSFFVKKDNAYIRFCEQHIQRAHNVDEIKMELENTGFELLAANEAFTDNKFTSTSERIQFTARKL